MIYFQKEREIDNYYYANIFIIKFSIEHDLKEMILYNNWEITNIGQIGNYV